jgi:hypothetical protein
MDDLDCLAGYPFVVVRIACRVCSRRGSYRLARLAAKYGPAISLRDLTEQLLVRLPLAGRGAHQARANKKAGGKSPFPGLKFRI